MTMFSHSRYRFCEALEDDDGRLYLKEREPFLYRNRIDTFTHSTIEGETLDSIAAKRYNDQEYGARHWWAIGDFQDEDAEPIIDPTLRLTAGREISVPSARVLFGEILSEERRAEH